MESILGLASTEGMLFKFGSGTGSNLSSIRSSREPLAGGGTASGPVSFMRGYDAFAGVIKSGGKTRRAAKMVILNADHPDIVEFVNCKADEEKKAWALIDAGYDGVVQRRGGLRLGLLPEREPLGARHRRVHAGGGRGPRVETTCVTRGEPVRDLPGARPDREMAEAAWQCGDPGIQYDTTINDWHTCPNTARINALEPVLRVHVPRRHRLQPGEPQPDEVRGRRTASSTSRPSAPPAADDHRAGDPGRQLELPDRGDRREQPRLPAARPRLREPRRAADGPRACPTTPTRAAPTPRRSPR